MNNPANILIVDDEEVVRLSHLRSLQSANCNARVAEDGIEALKVMEQQPFDVILLDLRMPRVDGLDVLREIKGDDGLHTIPVVVLTTSDADRDIQKAYEYNTNSYLTKPLSFGEFEDLIDQIPDYWLRWNVQLDSEDLG